MNLLVLAIPHHDYFFFTHAGDDEVSGIGYLTLMTNKQPASGVYLFQLLLVDGLVDVNLPVYQPLLEVKELTKRTIDRTKHRNQGSPPCYPRYKLVGRTLSEKLV